VLSLAVSSSVTSANDSRLPSVGVAASMMYSCSGVAGAYELGDNERIPVCGDGFSGDVRAVLSDVLDDEAGIDRNELLEGFELSVGRLSADPTFSHIAAAAWTRLGDFFGVNGSVVDLAGEAGETSTSSNDSSSSSSSCAACMAISVGEDALVMVLNGVWSVE